MKNTPSEQSEGGVDHYVWEAFYIPDHWDDPRGELLAVSKELAQELIAEEADVPNAGWEETTEDELYQLTRTTHHVVTVKRVPVYG